MEMNSNELLAEVEKMKDGLSDHSTGGSWEDGEYKRIRSLLLQDQTLKPMVPDFVLNYRNLGDFWQFIKAKFAHYAERRKFLADEFSQLLNYLEFGDQVDAYSSSTKNKLLHWLAEAGETEKVQRIERCELLLEPYSDVLIPLNGDDFYEPYDLLIKAPRDVYDLLESETSSFKQEVYKAVGTLLEGRDVLREIRVIPLVNSSLLNHEQFQIIRITSSQEIQETWRKLLDRINKDPEGAITTARSLVEDVCKYILDGLGEEYGTRDDLPELYKKVARKLSLAPENHKEDVYKQILGGTNSVVSGLASLRNALGDSHGKGKKAPKPSPRHARLAVNVAATASLFLIETYQSRSQEEDAK